MVEAGILIPNDEPSNWRSQSFPRMKPGSDPPKCRWVTDFRKLNSHLKRPIWGAESSSQILRRVDPEARYFACFDATSGFHQIRVCDESSKLMTIVTQYGTYRYTVLGQGICSSICYSPPQPFWWLGLLLLAVLCSADRNTGYNAIRMMGLIDDA